MNVDVVLRFGEQGRQQNAAMCAHDRTAFDFELHALRHALQRAAVRALQNSQRDARLICQHVAAIRNEHGEPCDEGVRVRVLVGRDGAHRKRALDEVEVERRPRLARHRAEGDGCRWVAQSFERSEREGG